LDKSSIKSYFPDVELMHWRHQLQTMVLELKDKIT
jgi:hypothetical protein